MQSNFWKTLSSISANWERSIFVNLGLWPVNSSSKWIPFIFWNIIVRVLKTLKFDLRVWKVPWLLYYSIYPSWLIWRMNEILAVKRLFLWYQVAVLAFVRTTKNISLISFLQMIMVSRHHCSGGPTLKNWCYKRCYNCSGYIPACRSPLLLNPFSDIEPYRIVLIDIANLHLRQKMVTYLKIC